MGEMTDKTFAGKKILVADDSAEFLKALTTVLASRGFKVVPAANGRIAKDLIEHQDFDVILTDVHMPHMDGVELLKWIKANRTTPVVVMTGFTNLLETQAAYELGASEFIAKPFKSDEIFPVLEKVLFPKSAKKEPELSIEQVFCKISLDEFVSRLRTEFDLFVKLGEKKIIKIGRAGDSISAERIRTYQEKGLKHLYIRRDDFRKLIEFNAAVTKFVSSSELVPAEKKLKFMRRANEVLMEQAFFESVDQEFFAGAKDVFGTTVSLISDNPEQLELLETLNSHSDWLYGHSIGSAIFSMMIALKLGKNSTQTLYFLAMSGLFHEIGFREISRAIIDKPRSALAPGERSIIEKHSARAKEILGLVGGVPVDVIEIIYQHHEDSLGQGYPQGLTSLDIHPLAKIFQMADIFCNFAIKGPQYVGGSGLDAIYKTEEVWGGRVDGEALNALKSLFAMV